MLLGNVNLSDLVWVEQTGELLFSGNFRYSLYKDNYQGWLVLIWVLSLFLFHSFIHEYLDQRFRSKWQFS